VRIILTKAHDAAQAAQAAAALVAMHDAKLGEPDRKLPVRVGLASEHDAVARARHWLEPDALAPVVLPEEHVVGVVGEVAGHIEDLGVEHLRRHDLLVPLLPALVAHQLDQLVVNVAARWEEEGRARSQVVGKPEVLSPPDLLVAQHVLGALLRTLGAALGLLLLRAVGGVVFIFGGFPPLRDAFRTERIGPGAARWR